MVEPPSAAPPRAMAVDADQNARIHQMVAQEFNPYLVYAEFPPLNKRRSSAVSIDANLLTRSQVGGSCYLFVVVLMIYTSYLRYMLEKRFAYFQSLAYTNPEFIINEDKMQFESLEWVSNTVKNPEVCETTLPRDIVNVYAHTIKRTNEMHIQGDNWRPFSVMLTDVGGKVDYMLFSVLNACGIFVPEDNFVALVLKNIPHVADVRHVYTVRKDSSMYLRMTMPEIVTETTHYVSSYNASLISPFIVSFGISDKPNGPNDQGLRVDSTAIKRCIAILESVMMYIELFKQKYHDSEIRCTHFSMAVTRVSYGLNGELLLDDESHAVLVEIDEDQNVYVFDGNNYNSQPFEVWYAWFSADKYMEILEISVAMVPIIVQSAIRMI
ncbi:hypothetical protein EXVG_00281 [Emiliania huxleyi virus 202]|nr:hypothetical protein EXVG_00281 [Emiliania huxleyi virus 202]AHA54099.1 putative membrane protein [Emiliania huxleyi virus 18]AHA55147.1 putative membrane protein [Emiliania huxleyi virus 156]